MTKSEEKLLELLMEKVEKLEADLAEVKESSGGTVVHNHSHFHSHYHGPRVSNPWYGNWPYYTTWNMSNDASAPMKTGYVSSGAGSGISSASGSGLSSGSYSLVAGSSGGGSSSKLGGSANYNRLEDTAEIQVLAISR